MKATQYLAMAAAAMVLAAPAQAVTWGEPDGGTNPHVGTLLFVQNGVGFYSCTGTLIDAGNLEHHGAPLRSHGQQHVRHLAIGFNKALHLVVVVVERRNADGRRSRCFTR